MQESHTWAQKKLKGFQDLVAADFVEQGCVRSFYDPALFIKWQPKSGIDPEPPPTGSKQKGRLPNAGFAKDDPRLKDRPALRFEHAIFDGHVTGHTRHDARRGTRG